MYDKQYFDDRAKCANLGCIRSSDFILLKKGCKMRVDILFLMTKKSAQDEGSHISLIMPKRSVNEEANF